MSTRSERRDGRILYVLYVVPYNSNATLQQSTRTWGVWGLGWKSRCTVRLGMYYTVLYCSVRMYSTVCARVWSGSGVVLKGEAPENERVHACTCTVQTYTNSHSYDGWMGHALVLGQLLISKLGERHPPRSILLSNALELGLSYEYAQSKTPTSLVREGKKWLGTANIANQRSYLSLL